MGETYPAKQLDFEVDNLELSRLVVDGLRINLRKILLEDAEVNSFEKWMEKMDGDAFEVFHFDITALKFVEKTVEYLANYP